MKQFLLVFIGGGFGSGLRYIIGKYLNSSETGIPYGTFAANIIGSLLIGVILGLAAKNDALSQNQTLLLATGFCGGFTTFSSFAYNNLTMIKEHSFAQLLWNVGGSLFLGILAVYLGMILIKAIF